MLSARDMLVIKDERGEIVGAQVVNPDESNVSTFISPSRPEHTLHMVADVPAEVFSLADPADFHRAITRHVNSERAKVKKTSAEELHLEFSRPLASRAKNMLIITNENGEIVAAQAENPVNSSISTFISPSRPDQTLHRISGVPAEILGLADPVEFQKAITRHVKSDGAKIAKISVEELRATYSRNK